MTTFTISESNEIVAFSSPEEASAAVQTPFDSFSSEQELGDLAAGWPAERLLAILNSLPGEKPAKKLKDPKTAVARIWARIQDLGEGAKPEPEATKPEKAAAKPKDGKKATGRAPAAKGAPAKGKAGKKTTAAKSAAKGKKGAGAKAKEAQKAKESGEPKTARAGSKSEEVIALLKRKGGATMAEIVALTGWQKHTTRGWVSGFLGKKMGIAVESFKSDKGERTYRINK